MDSRGIQYLELRARQEREAAERAENPKVRDVHLELADRYLEALRSAQSLSAIGSASRDETVSTTDRAPFKVLN